MMPQIGSLTSKSLNSLNTDALKESFKITRLYSRVLSVFTALFGCICNIFRRNKKLSRDTLLRNKGKERFGNALDCVTLIKT